MMKIIARRAALAVAGLLVLATSAPSYALVARPLAAPTAAVDHSITQAPITHVRWRGGGWGWGGAGLAAGALLGAGIAASGPYYYAPYYYGPTYYGPPPAYYGRAPAGDDAVAYCMQRYRSYDPESGTFMGYDGLRHPCP